MTKPPRANLNKSDKCCPHCGGALEGYWSPRANGFGKRCQVCKCRFSPQGLHWFVGTFCPLQYKLPITA